MATEKRARQRANRQQKIEELEQENRRDKFRQYAFIGVIVAIVLVAGFALLTLTSGGDDSEAADDQADDAGSNSNAEPDSADDPEPDSDANTTQEIWPVPADVDPALLDASLATETAPDTFQARFETTKGEFVVEVNREWAPNGADRFYNLINIGFYEQTGFFRTIDGFMAQFGISPYPEISDVWRGATIDDDPVVESNTRGRVTFATSGPNSRTTQLFISYGDNSRLDADGFSPFGEVIEGMDVVDSLYMTGESQPTGTGPIQNDIQFRGGAYLEAEYPDIDIIERITIVE